MIVETSFVLKKKVITTYVGFLFFFLFYIDFLKNNKNNKTKQNKSETGSIIAETSFAR